MTSGVIFVSVSIEIEKYQIHDADSLPNNSTRNLENLIKSLCVIHGT